MDWFCGCCHPALTLHKYSATKILGCWSGSFVGFVIPVLIIVPFLYSEFLEINVLKCIMHKSLQSKIQHFILYFLLWRLFISDQRTFFYLQQSRTLDLKNCSKILLLISHKISKSPSIMGLHWLAQKTPYLVRYASHVDKTCRQRLTVFSVQQFYNL